MSEPKSEIAISREEVQREADEIAALERELIARRNSYELLGVFLRAVDRAEWVLPLPPMVRYRLPHRTLRRSPTLSEG